MRFALIDRAKAEFPIHRLCGVLGVSQSGIERSDGPISRTSTPGTEAMASRFSSDWLVSIIGTIRSPLFTVSRQSR